jgi:sugar/nucleoside kinase (ribokinase family)
VDGLLFPVWRLCSKDWPMDDVALFAGPPICVVGNINRDVKVQGVPRSPALLQDGETSVPPIVETIGGGGANSACAAAALGGNVRFLGKVGSDALGERLARAMEKHGVQTYLARDAGLVTGTTVALGWSTGERHFLSCLPNNESLSFGDLNLTALEGCAHLLRADVWFSRSMLEEGNLRLFAEARRRGIVTSMDLNFDPCWSTGQTAEIARRKQWLRETLGFVDLAHGNVRELCESTDSGDIDTALRRLTDWGVKGVVVHFGAKGAGFWGEGRLTIEPPSLAGMVVNSTGTGDVLSMCMILLHTRTELSIEQKLRASNKVVREFMEGRRALIPEI